MMEQREDFMNLPSEYLAMLVNDWMSWKEWGRLDSALCKNSCRQEWLSLLRNFLVAPLAYIHSIGTPPAFKWLVRRQVRTSTLKIWGENVFRSGVACEWLRNTSSVLATVKLWMDKKMRSLTRIAQFCSKLKELQFDGCQIEESTWDIIQNIPSLRRLRIYDSTINIITVPAHFTHPFIEKLAIHWPVFASGNALALLQQLPALRTLNIGEYSMIDIYDTLPAACPNLVYLDLGGFNYEEDDNALFVELMKGLKGLLGLVLPMDNMFTEMEFQFIVQYHSHSLDCLRIIDSEEIDQEEWIVDLVNSLPYLDTLVITSRCLDTTDTHMVNPSVTELYIDFDGDSLSTLQAASINRFPELTILTLFNFDSVAVASDFVQVLKLCTRIQRVYVDDDKLAPEANSLLPDIVRMEYGHFDIFTYQYED